MCESGDLQVFGLYIAPNKTEKLAGQENFFTTCFSCTKLNIIWDLHARAGEVITKESSPNHSFSRLLKLYSRLYCLFEVQEMFHVCIMIAYDSNET